MPDDCGRSRSRAFRRTTWRRTRCSTRGFRRGVSTRFARAIVYVAAHETGGAFTIWLLQWRSSARADPRGHDPSVFAAPERTRTGDVSASEVEAGWSGRWACRSFKNKGCAWRSKRRASRRSSRSVAPRDGTQALARADGGDLSQADRRHGAERHRARSRRAALPHAARLRRLRFSGIARRQLRAALVRFGLRQCHEPAVFLAAILNVQPMGFYSTEVLVNDARRHDVVVRPVEVNASESWSFVDAGGSVRLGFHVTRGLGEAQRAQLESAVAAGMFADLPDFAARSGLSKMRSRTWRSRAPSHRGSVRAGKRCGRCALSTSEARAANSAGRWRSTTNPKRPSRT